VIQVNLDSLLADRGMTLVQLSELVGVSVVNLSILKNGHAKAIRFSTHLRRKWPPDEPHEPARYGSGLRCADHFRQ
jgi:Cro/C1-type HTH DNA-binding domain